MSALPQAVRPQRLLIGPQQTGGHCSVLNLATFSCLTMVEGFWLSPRVISLLSDLMGSL